MKLSDEKNCFDLKSEQQPNMSIYLHVVLLTNWPGIVQDE